MFSDVRDHEKITGGFKSYLCVKAHGLLSGVTPEKGALILLDDGKGRAKQR